MTGKAGKSHHHVADAHSLQDENSPGLEQINELQQHEVPRTRPTTLPRPPLLGSTSFPDTHVPGSIEATSANRPNAQTQEPPLSPLSPLSPLTLSPGIRVPPAHSRPPLHRSTATPGLYTIESHTIPAPEATGQAKLAPSPAEYQRRGGSSREEPRISLTRPRQRFDDIHGDVKDAMASAQEANATLAQYRNWVGRRREKKRKRTSTPWGRIRGAAISGYKRYIVEGLLRQRPLPPSKDGRHIPLRPGLARRKPLDDERTGHPYVANVIRSSRYTIWDFLPKQLFFQFSKLANFYFLVIGVMQMIPGLSTTGTYTTIAPLIFFVAFSMGKEGFDDYRRYQLDKQENRSSAWVLDPERTIKPNSRQRRRDRAIAKKEKAAAMDAGADAQMTELEMVGTSTEDPEPGHWAEVEWQDIRVGDIIRLRRDDPVPADIALLHATGPNGLAYIETMALDGETNLKSKQASPLLAEGCSSVARISALEAEVVSEDPNLDLYNYEGRVTANGKTMPLTINQVVYRGSTLRNTTEAVGLVINTGEECKIRMNAHKDVHAKAPEMQYTVNRIVILLVFFVVSLSIGLTVGYQIWRHRTESKAFYLRRSSVPIKEILIGYIIMFNTLIPLSLYVSLEITKLGQLYFLHDVEMYDPVSDTPMSANTSTILENLGQVSYVFSDKTGTLTENIMKFRKMSVAGTAWLHDVDLKEAEKKRNGGMSPTKGLDERPDRGRLSTTSRRTGTHLGVDDAHRIGRRSTSRPASTVNQGQTQPELLNTDDLLRYLRHKPSTSFSRKVRHFILCLALCHTCLPETGDDGEIRFQAASPDELALVEAARDLGYLLIDRPAQSIKLQSLDANGSTVIETYDVLDVIEFSSKRKRMSIVVRMPDGKLCLFIKGADSTVLPRLRQRQLAVQAASAVERRASLRKSMEQEKALRRLSMHSAHRDSMTMGRASSTIDRRRSQIGGARKSFTLTGDFDSWLTRRENEHNRRSMADDPEHFTRPSMTRPRPSVDTTTFSSDPYDGFVDESLSLNESVVFERCFQHVDDFASEGLRTLIYAYRHLEEEEYLKWKEVYHDATTSLVNRQEQTEAAAELIEQNFDLAGATAIEDKLQHGVPETIDNLSRANIKVWMLTGDKRETAINIAHSARIAKPFSEVYILDETQDNIHEKVAATLIDVGRGMVPHSVVVIDGHTLSVVEEDESLKILFFDLVARVDSVICCRASPSQKATLVKSIRDIHPAAVTLAIGDGANDIAMIQASHVGIGISGREGLQAARISDFSIAQFRFLQRLLFVHGRWIYIRTGKYVLATFWKEMIFYCLQAHFQHYNGFTGTSLFESVSLTVFNTVFTSLCVILPGILEKDLSAKTLMAVPELYTFGQRNQAFNMKKYFGWMLMALIESAMIFYSVYYLYAYSHSPVRVDLFAVGQLAYCIVVIFINVKLFIIEVHSRSIIIFAGFFLSLVGWFLFNILLGALYARTHGPYVVRGGFTLRFGRTKMWWLIVFLVLSAVLVFELAVITLRKTFFPTDQDVMQEMEKVPGAVDLLRDGGAAGGDAEHGEMGGVGNMEGITVTDVDGDKGLAAGRRGDVVSIKTMTSRSSLAAEGGFTWPWEGSNTGNNNNKRGSRHLVEEFPLSTITPLREERENSGEIRARAGGEGSGSTPKKGRVRISSDADRRWIYDLSASPSGESGAQPWLTPSPVEGQGPRSERRAALGSQHLDQV